ncbi:hypothetical protein FISHEDRAFT_66463 [Fistulina hepatica ATCC 64428]|uniref:Uncharacterized protein n=1 Tax=Fistulina hepatica ATCC 64428 TaxID=1128425 RepID=A0A0D7A6U8_9AGAR|nr:hypothetical protein FISHEDRAFT_66463 [Fistulina hepatica ATCC 64428]
MVDWTSAEELARDSNGFIKFMHVIFGLYVWEWAMSLDFDWEYITRRRAFRWPLIFYFVNRYIVLFALIGIEIDCTALYTFNQASYSQYTGDAALGLASVNLSIRTIAVWSQNRIITVALVIAILGQWSLILQGGRMKAEYTSDDGCAITSSNNTILAATYIYTMCLDFTVLALMTWKLLGPKLYAQGFPLPKLSTLLFRDGLIYFIYAFLSNLVAAVFMMLNLNEVMSVIFNVPAAVGSSVCTCVVPYFLLSITLIPTGRRMSSGAQAGTLRDVSAGAAHGHEGIRIQVRSCIHI